MGQQIPYFGHGHPVHSQRKIRVRRPKLQLYKPTSSSGSYTTTAGLQANVGTDSVGFSLGISWGYTTDFVTIADQGDYSVQRAKWLHDVREDQNPGKNTYQIEPGATYKVPGDIYGYWGDQYPYAGAEASTTR